MRKPPKPIRLGVGCTLPVGPALLKTAQAAERAGFSTFGLPDHFSWTVAPLIALQAVADATSSLRLTQVVLAADFRHPAVLAKEFATLDGFSGGRLEIGIGAGWKRAEYEQAGIPFDRPSVRIERLEEALIVLKGLFADEPLSFSGTHFTIRNLEGLPKPVQRPHPPIVVGGGGKKLLSVAARQANIVQIIWQSPKGNLFIDPSQLGIAAFEEKLSWVQDAAGPRFNEIELSTLLMSLTITDDPKTSIEAFRHAWGTEISDLGGEFKMTVKDIEDSPMFAFGTVDEITEKLLALRDRYGVSYFMVQISSPESARPLIERLKGR